MAQIMVIDDDDSVRVLIVSLLEALGHNPTGFSNGKKAISALKTALPDLVITDMVMPEKDGIETIQEIRVLCPTLPILAISGGTAHLSTAQLFRMATHMGAIKVLSKPFTIQELSAALIEMGIS